MNKKILISLSVIAAVAAVVVGGTVAYFSDRETSTGNVFTAGTIDIAIDGQNPWEGKFEMKDLKPCETVYIDFVISNPGENPVNVWKHIKNVVTDDGEVTEPECEYGGGRWNKNGACVDDYKPWNRIDRWILYDLSVFVPIADNKDGGWWQTIYDENVTVEDITSKEVFLGMIPAHGTMKVTQSYHLKPETENWAQGDRMTFDIEIFAEQLRGELVLNTKSEDDNWLIQRDGTWGKLTYNLTGPTFDYEFNGYKLDPTTKYCLIYYADPWPGDGEQHNTGALIGCKTTDSNGDLALNDNPDLGMDLPQWPSDQNHPEGAKIWLVTATDYNNGTESTGPMTAWNPGNYLFETGLITYDDTDI